MIGSGAFGSTSRKQHAASPASLARQFEVNYLNPNLVAIPLDVSYFTVSDLI